MATNMKKKAERVEEKREKRPYAVAKYIRISPYKVRTVLALIRGKSVEEAEAILSNITNGGAAPTAELILDCRVSEMNEELAGMFRDEMRDYYELTDQEIESLGTLLMVEPRSFTTVRIFSGAGAGFVLLGLLLLVLRWRKVSAVERARQEAL